MVQRSENETPIHLTGRWYVEQVENYAFWKRVGEKTEATPLAKTTVVDELMRTSAK